MNQSLQSQPFDLFGKFKTKKIINYTPIERKICRFLKLMNSVLKAQLSYLLRHLFRIRGFLISPPSPLRWGSCEKIMKQIKKD